MKRAFLLCVSLLAGCAGFSADGGRRQVDALTAARGLPASAGPADGQVKALLAQPLSADDAVRVALLNNPQLRAAYAELGIAEADLVQAGRLPNPSFSFKRTGSDYERTLLLPLYALFTLPQQQELGQHRFTQAQTRTAQQALALADDTRRAYYAALAAQQMLAYMEQVKQAADASADLARRMAQAGNWSPLQEAREQAFHADAVTGLARARQQLLQERERLTRALGLNAPEFKLPERLPDLPAAPRVIEQLEASALRNRLDILAAEQEVSALASEHQLVQTNRFLNVLEAGPVRASAGSGIEIGLELPIFDWGDARAARAKAAWDRAAAHAQAAAIAARSEVRAAHAGYLASYEIARHYRDRIVPLRQRIAEEQRLRYNGMLSSVFELLADAREQIQAVNAAIEAQRDFWQADAALTAALTAGTPNKDTP